VASEGLDHAVKIPDSTVEGVEQKRWRRF